MEHLAGRPTDTSGLSVIEFMTFPFQANQIYFEKYTMSFQKCTADLYLDYIFLYLKINDFLFADRFIKFKKGHYTKVL